MSAKDQPLTSQRVRESLEQLVSAQRFLVGFSGGADSTALLTALSRQRARLPGVLEAIHFNHGLHDQCQAWQVHCEAYCAELEIPLTTHSLALPAGSGNIEAMAREARYAFVEQRLEPGGVYLTAHNRDDQAETLLLHALRGSGIDGMAGIPAVRRLGQGRVARPLLGESRVAIEHYLRSNQLKWIEDDSNRDTRFDRNFLRHEVIPLLESRWPAAAARLAATATHLGATATALETLLGQHARLDGSPGLSLPLGSLQPLDSMAPLVIRAWLRRHNVAPPPQARLNELLVQLQGASRDKHCEMRWSNHALRLYGDALYLSDQPDLPACPQRTWHDAPTLDLGEALGVVTLRGDRLDIPAGWSIGPRRAGGAMRTDEAGPNRKLKKLIQEHPIPPWQRNSVPLLYWDDEPAAVGDWLLAPRLRDWLGRQGIEFSWQPEAPELVETRDACQALWAGRNPG